MLLNAISEPASQCFKVGGAFCEDLDQTRLRGLTGQSLVNDLVAGSIPESSVKGGIVRKSIDIVLRGTSDGHGKDTFANQFIDCIANSVNPSWILDVRGDRINHSESMIGFTK